MLKTASIDINGFRVTTTQLPCERGFDVLGMVATRLPKDIPSGVSRGLTKGIAGAVDPTSEGFEGVAAGGASALYTAARGILRNPATVRSLLETFGSVSIVRIDGKDLPFNDDRRATVFHSEGADYAAVFEFLWFCLELNFKSLSNLMPSEGKDAITAIRGAVENAAQSPFPKG